MKTITIAEGTRLTATAATIAPMTYTLEHVQNALGSFWVIYEDDGVFEREIFHSRDIAEARKVLRELRNE